MSTHSRIRGPQRWAFNFTLKERCTFERIENPPDIELRTERNNNGTVGIIGFEITVPSRSQKKARNSAVTQAYRLKDILALLSKQYIDCSLTGEAIIRPDGSRKLLTQTTIRSHRRGTAKATNLGRRKFPSLITGLNLQPSLQNLVEGFKNANNGLEAYENERYELMIREFYLVIEEEVDAKRFPKGDKYKFLRHAVSHAGVLNNSTINGLSDPKYFPKGYFDLPNNRFDHYSSKNQKNVKKEAKKLMRIALNQLRQQL
jgi:hypothetical protein